MKTSTLILSIALGLSGGAAQAETSFATSIWARAVNSGDATALASLYTSDAVLVSPGTEIVSAPGAISEFWAAKRKAGASDFQVVSVNERTEGNRVYQSAVWASTFNSNGQISEMEGQMTNVLVRQDDGRWKIQLQSWN